MSSLIEVIAKQAQKTFSRGVAEEYISERISKLVSIVKSARACDLNVDRDILSLEGDEFTPQVSYIAISENSTFSMGIFVLKSGGQIPLHDHPGMFGILKVIFGTVKINSYSKLSNVPSSLSIPHDIVPLVKDAPRHCIFPVEQHTSGYVTDKDDPCIVKPREGNFHEINAIDGPAAFLDILAPPYEMDGMNCHYYRLLESRNTNAECRSWLVRKS